MIDKIDNLSTFVGPSNDEMENNKEESPAINTNKIGTRMSLSKNFEIENEIRELNKMCKQKKQHIRNSRNNMSTLINDIKILNQEIAELENDVTVFTNANNLYTAIEASLSINREANVSNHSEINLKLDVEHVEIINKGKDSIEPLREESEKLTDDLHTLEEKLSESRITVSKSLNELIELQEEVNFQVIQNDYIQDKIEYVTNQLSSYTLQLNQLNQMKTKAENAHAFLKERHEQYVTSDNGILLIDKQIVSLQVQLEDLDGQISRVNEQIKNTEEMFAKLRLERAQEEEKFRTLVDWESEKKELHAELKRIQKEVRDKRDEITQKEKANQKSMEKYEKYKPYVEKWHNRGDDIDTSNVSIIQTFKEIEEIKKLNAERESQTKAKLIELVSNNAKLEKQLVNARNKLTTVIKQFQTEEAFFSRKSLEDRRRLEEEESKLIEQINDIKLRVATFFLADKK